MLEAQDLTVSLAGRPVLRGVSVRVETGTSLAIVGPSGSGKTTLLNVLSLALAADSGQLMIDGTDMTRVTERQRRHFWGRSAAFVLQDYGLIDDETAGYNVLLSDPPLRKQRAVTDPRALSALESVGLADRAGTTVAALSGGEKQRVGIARALAKDARFVFADEPTASLDRANRDRVEQLLLGTAGAERTVIISTHDRELAARCDTVLRLEAGALAPMA